MSVTHGNAGGDETLVATPPTGYTIGSKGLTAGSNINLTSDANTVTISGLNAPEDSPICIVRRDTTSSVTNNNPTTFSWTHENVDTEGMWDSGTPTLFTIPEDGYYLINAVIRWTGHASSDGYVSAIIGVSSGPTIAYDYQYCKGTAKINTNPCVIYPLNAMDTFALTLFNFTGQTVSTDTSTFLPTVQIIKIRQ